MERPAGTFVKSLQGPQQKEQQGDDKEEKKDQNTPAAEQNPREAARSKPATTRMQKIGARNVKRDLGPKPPSPEEARERQLIHVPCQSLCHHCIKGRG